MGLSPLPDLVLGQGSLSLLISYFSWSHECKKHILMAHFKNEVYLVHKGELQ